MPEKRDRPQSINADDPAAVRRRQLTAERTRQYRERQRAARTPVQQATLPQLQQGERIVSLAFTEEDAAITLTQLGLRVQGVTLAQDAGDARLQQEAVPVDEHEALYQDNHLATGNHQQQNIANSPRDHQNASSTSSVPVTSRAGRSDLSRYFPTLPPRNPLSALPSSLETDRPITSRPLQPPLPFVDDSPGFWQDDDDDYPIESRRRHNDGDQEDEIGGTADNDHDEGESRPEIEERLRSSPTTPPRKASTEPDPDQIHDSDDESSAYDFVSEHSEHPDADEESDDEVSAHDYTVQKLYNQLQGGHHGCSVEEHEEQLHEHMNAGGNNHHGLNDIFNDPAFPSVLALSELISADRLAQQAVPTPAQWQAMFCGVPAQQRRTRPRPMNVCLHQEETQAVEPQVAFDIDSFLGFANSLAMARQGLWYQPAPQMRQNMTTDVHLETNLFQDSEDPDQAPRSSLAILRDVPHFLLGRVVGAHDITVHILFPHLTPVSEKFVSLTKEQHSRWLDQIFHPAIYRHCEAHYTQHLPASYRHALANSKAHQVEGRKVETASYQAQQSIGYHLQPEYLDAIWTSILDNINSTPGLADFRDPQLFFAAKGTKLQFKTSPSRPTMLDAMENFQSYFERVVDLDCVFLDRFYVDVGKEICPRVSLLASQQCHMGDEAQVYMWKRCCLEHYLREMYDGQPPARDGQGQRYYDQNMLYEASSLTSVTPKPSKLRQGGMIYTQFYGSVKEISDATKCKPFDNDGLEELALDPQIRQGARNAAGGHRRDAKIIERGYCASKRRARDALVDSIKKSFGVREEHRMTWSLYQGLISRLRREARDDLEIVLDDCPSYAWAIKTETYVNFLWRSADKFASGFEVVLAGCQQDLVTWEQTKMMAMFLRCLRFVFGGHQLQRESALWWSRRERPTRTWYGLGFCNTLLRYKYCWLEPRIDWSRLSFKSAITDEVLFGNSMLRGQYLRRGGQVRDFFNATRQLELALEWIDSHHENATIRDRLVHWMVHICLQQFRLDVLISVKAEISEDKREEALQGTRAFCLEYFEEIMENGVYLISGNRCDFKQASHLGHFLFDFGDGRARTHWEDRPFRKLYHRARTALSLRHGILGLGRTFSRRFWRHLYVHHWIFPYPCAEVLMQTTKAGQRMWYSIEAVATASGRIDMREPDQWQWARKSWQQGHPPALPRYLTWSKEEWQGWIERHGGG